MEQYLTHLDWTALATLTLALVAVGSILQTQALRRNDIRRQDELAFRRALRELWGNVQHLGGWSQLEERPSKRWEAAALTFTDTNNLLAAVWIPLKLWYRIQSMLWNIKAYAIRVDDAVAKGGANELRWARDGWYIADLYLKQLVRYLFAEMRRRRIGMPVDWRASQPLCEPLAHYYAPADDSPAKAAYNLEHALTVPPHVPWADEPDDPAYAECRLETLIARARERHAQDQAQLKRDMGGWERRSNGRSDP